MASPFDKLRVRNRQSPHPEPAEGRGLRKRSSFLSEDTIEQLDLRGLKCPLPALLARKRLAGAPARLFAIEADDPMAFVDIQHMCREEGHEMVSAIREGDAARFVIRARG